MGHLTLELILWLLLAFFIGCILGCLFRKVFGGGSQDGTTTAAVADVKPETKPAPEPKSEPLAAMATGVAKRPKGLAAARDGKADKLQRISGVGPKLDKTLNSLGYFHFDQIAKWSPDEVQWVDEDLRFKGRIERDEWIPQAKLLAAGKEEEFTRLYGSGGVNSTDSAASQSSEPARRIGSAKPAPKRVKETKKPAPKPAVATGVAKAPKKLKAAKGGKADDLQRISGVGPKLEKTLHGLGFYHFDQVAGWTPDEVQWVDENLRFKGRIDREEWIPQAKLLAAGDESKFAKNYGTGGKKDEKTGKTQPGSRTKKS